MDTKELKCKLLSGIETEIGLWADESQTLQDSYSYESQFIERVRKINHLLLQTSVESLCKERDKKKSKVVLVG